MKASIEFGTSYAAYFIIGPVDKAIDTIIVNGNGMLDTFQRQDHIGVIWSIQRDSPQIGTSGQQQQLLGTVSTGEVVHQSGTGRAGTGEPGRVRSRQTQMRTLPILVQTGKGTERLSFMIVNMNVHGGQRGTQNGFPSGSRLLVARVNRFGLPVGPVQPIFVHGQSKRMLEIALADGFPARPVQTGRTYYVQLRIGPEYRFVLVINGQAVGPENIVFDDDLPGAQISVHTGRFYLGILAPVGPEQQSLPRKEAYRSRLIQVLPEQNLAIISLQVGHLQAIRFTVRPVQLVSQPIDCQPVR